MYTKTRKVKITILCVTIFIGFVYILSSKRQHYIQFSSLKNFGNYDQLLYPRKRRDFIESMNIVPSYSSGITENVDVNSRQNAYRGYYVNNHCAIPNIIKRSMPNDPERISLILHVSYDYLNMDIIYQLKNWDGPISLTVVFPMDVNLYDNQVLCTTNFLKNLKMLSKDAKKKLSVHFMFHNYSLKQSINAFNCFKVTSESYFKKNTDILKCNFEVDEETKLQRMAHYPINDARNLARNLTSTKYILTADMDHLFSKNFEAKMLHLAQKWLVQYPKLALTYRIFEVDKNVTNYPRNKKELKRLMDKGLAQVFHDFNGIHRIPYIDDWFKKPETTPNQSSIQFITLLKYNHKDWEPQFVSLNTIPYHDPTFLYPIKDNTVLRWEMCRAGYEFAIVDDVFMFHPGIKTRAGNVPFNKIRHMIWKNSTIAGYAFEERMDKLYPNSKDSCILFNWPWLEEHYAGGIVV